EKKPMPPISFDFSATMMLATEPRNVRFPANVDATASSSQAASGAGIAATSGAASSTNGTFDTTLDPTSITPAVRAQASAPAPSYMGTCPNSQAAPPSAAKPSVTTNNPANSTMMGQSIPSHTCAA